MRWFYKRHMQQHSGQRKKNLHEKRCHFFRTHNEPFATSSLGTFSMLSAANGYSSMYSEAPFEAAANLWGENMRLIIWIYGYLPRLRSSLDTTAVVVDSGLLLRSWLCSLWFFCFSLLLCVICITNGNIMRQTGEKATIAALRRFWNAQNQAEFGTSQVDSSKIMVPWESSNLFESLLLKPKNQILSLESHCWSLIGQAVSLVPSSSTQPCGANL